MVLGFLSLIINCSSQVVIMQQKTKRQMFINIKKNIGYEQLRPHRIAFHGTRASSKQ